MDRAAPLESQEKADDGADEEEGAEDVDLSDLFAEGEVRVASGWVGEEKEDHEDGNCSEGLDIEGQHSGHRHLDRKLLTRLSQKQKRHVSLGLSVNTPPRTGPTTDAMPNILDSAAMYMALFRKGTLYATIVMPPLNKAEAPTPAIARPTINIVELVAAAQMTLPSSKISNAVR
jgi:hypothetical protein